MYTKTDLPDLCFDLNPKILPMEYRFQLGPIRIILATLLAEF